jgi:hypothetical protein
MGTYFQAITTRRDRLPELVAAREFLANETVDELTRLGL